MTESSRKLAMGNELRQAFEILSSGGQEAFSDIFMMSNPVLSKNISNNNFLKRYLNKSTPRSLSLAAIMRKLLFYYIKSFIHFALYLYKYMEYFFVGRRFYVDADNKNELILIDTFFIVDKIDSSRKFTEYFFPGLEEVLREKKKKYAYLPVFFSPKRITHIYKILKILKKDSVPILSEYQLLSPFDLLRILFFCVAYPFHALGFSRKLKVASYGEELLVHELRDTLDQVAFYGYARFLQGRRASELPYKNIKVISWYENQAIHKNLYAGLRNGGNRVRIYGSQLFLYSPGIINITADENEMEFGAVPDKILVSGPVYIPERTNLTYAVGPSLRYAKVFKTSLHMGKRKDILILLPMSKEEADNILRMLANPKLSALSFNVKSHPATDIRGLKQLVTSNMKLVNEDIYKLFESTKIVIGADSGSLVEAVALGIPVIALKGSGGYDMNPLPEYGKGVVWEEADNAETLQGLIIWFEQQIKDRAKEIESFAAEYKKMFFCEPTKENIVAAFDL